jgi:hypothetical protein
LWRYRETRLMPEAMQLDTWIAIRSPLHRALALFCHPERREGSAFPFASHRPSPVILNPSDIRAKKSRLNKKLPTRTSPWINAAFKCFRLA